MKRLLRGVIDWGSGISREGHVSNFQKLRASKVEWVQATDRKIFKFVGEFFTEEMDVPSSRILVDFFTSISDIETVERLKDIKEAAPYEGANYSHVLRTIIDEQHRAALASL